MHEDAGKLTVVLAGKIFVQYQLQLDESSGGAILLE